MDTIQKVLDEAYAEIGNPMVFFDTSYNLLAHTENPVTDDPIWNELLELKGFSIETVDFFNRANFVHAVATENPVALLQTRELKYDRATSKVYDDDGIQIACVTVVACMKPFESGDFTKLAELCERISKINSSSGEERITERSYSESWLSSLLSNSLDENVLPQCLGNITGNSYIAVVDISRYEPTLSHLEYFRDTFAKLQNKFTYDIFMTNIVILISDSSTNLRIQDDMKALNDFFNKYDIYAGLSACFNDGSEIRKYYKQAIVALNCGLRCQGEQRIFRYESLSLDGFLSAAGKLLPLDDFKNPAVEQILAYDKANGLDYYNTMDTYIKSASSYIKTCNQLHIEPDKLKERLDKMTELFDIRWDDCDQLASLLITMKITAVTDETK